MYFPVSFSRNFSAARAAPVRLDVLEGRGGRDALGALLGVVLVLADLAHVFTGVLLEELLGGAQARDLLLALRELGRRRLGLRRRDGHIFYGRGGLGRRVAGLGPQSYAPAAGARRRDNERRRLGDEQREGYPPTAHGCDGSMAWRLTEASRRFSGRSTDQSMQEADIDALNTSAGLLFRQRRT